MNSVNVIGRLATDPVARTAPDGEEQCALRLAVPRVDRSGLPEPGVVYVDVLVAGACALDVMATLRHGMRVGVSGRLELDEWVEDGLAVSRHEVLADQLELLDGPGEVAV